MIENLIVRKREYIRVLERAQRHLSNGSAECLLGAISIIECTTKSNTILNAAEHLCKELFERTNGLHITKWLVKNGVKESEITPENLNVYSIEWAERLKKEVLES